MKKLFSLWALLLSFAYLPALAQRATPDQVQTNKGPLTIQPILHGTAVLNWNGKTIYIDPYGGAAAFEGIAAPDLVLITDIHGDHLDQKTLDALNTSKASFVVPQAVADKLPENLKAKAVVLGNGENTTQQGIPITAVPMYNLPESPDARHIKGRGNGYILNLGDKNIYFSGDTEGIPEMRTLQNIDVAFVSMNLPYTMDVDQAADAVLDFQPRIVYPYHYRGQNGLSDVETFKRLVNEGNKNIEVRLRNWYPEY
ncbi:L-ascorbate metabolism protein UlaG (beta-lactamase superfamily) [Pontibacter ummariensis]|uniref:L-ascorbate metabolism protein UlaG, beta-lactamase superfamily n=1 Tax=Pontibacter ummariensis TaxID=1610492 RepID=A0A239ESQ1_9BACT|nr:MBL fold metallo-hydrolase [Pontibacter ummariensis]PRY12797.1 L-ascorbate metabolism protein UlaG (beta-lactamase superfamily) [Pontibacter ummariensis]SNS46922.1 L-ascorbate metabolism protein UlaG, beta-lactamase superfamily [Pontibacter ummariensis]